MLKTRSKQAVMLLLAGFTPCALAQDVSETANPDAATLEEVVVTGIRGSIQSAISLKRDSNSLVEVIAAEDIGKLPELTITESLARLPGLTSGRDRGNGAGVSVRGLGTELTGSLMNKRELATHNASRSPRFDQFPTELIYGASVYKSPIATQPAGGIAGTINLNTVRPLDITERKINLNANFEYQELAAGLEDGDAYGDRESISYIDQFMDDRLGVAVGFANSSRPVGTVRAAVFNPDPTEVSFVADGVDYTDVTLPYGYEHSVRTGSESRQGVVGALQFRPNDDFDINYDVFYSQFEVAEDQSGFRTGNLAAAGTLYADVDVVGGNFDSGTNTHTGGSVAAARMTGGFDLNNVNEQYREEDELLATGLNVVWNNGDAWEISADASYSRAERLSHFLSIETIQNNPTAHFDGTSAIPAFAFGTSLTDTASNLLPDSQEIINADSGGAQNVVDQVGALALDFSYDFEEGFVSSLEFGVRGSQREKEMAVGNQTVYLLDSNQVPNDMYLGSPLGSFDGDLRTTIEANPALRMDVDRLLAEMYGAEIQPQQDGDTRRRGWVISEDVMAAFLQANFEYDFSNGMTLSGNFGVRYEATETQADSVQLINVDNVETEEQLSSTNSFSDVLPSLNMSLDLNDSNKLRFSVSRALTRPPIDDLSPGAGVFVFDSADSYGGNPDLEPYRSTQLDLGYEYYHSEDTALTVAVFYKDLSTIIVNQTVPQDVDLDGNGIIENPNSDGRNETGTITQPVNQGEASIQGVEFSYNQAFTSLPSPFDGMGVYATVSFNDSDMVVEEAFNSGSFDFPGFSETNGNFTLWYATESFEMRAAYRFIDDFVRRVDGQALAINEAEAVLDMQASYYITDEFQVLFQAKNLTDDPYTTNHGNPDLHGRYEQFGRSYSIGFSYSL